MRRITLPFLALLALLPVAARALDGAPVRVEIPITAAALPGGGQRYSVPVSVEGGAPIPAMLDTGSVGLRLMPGAAPPALKPEGAPTKVNFASGVVLTGSLAEGQVAVGAAAPVRIKVQIADEADCLPGRPDCAAAKARPGAYRIGGAALPDGGFQAILGIGLRPGAAGNPLIPAGGVWIVELPRPGEAGPGRLILNPTPAEQQGFTLFRLAERRAPMGTGWLDNHLPACLSWGGGAPICGSAMLDTGAPQVSLAHAGATTPVRPGEPALLRFGEGPSINFTTGQSAAARLRVFAPRPGRPREGLNTGVLPFYSYEVLYDARRGVIGLKPRD